MRNCVAAKLQSLIAQKAAIDEYNTHEKASYFPANLLHAENAYSVV